MWYISTSGPGSIVGIATDYELDGPVFKSQGARFSAPVQSGPGAHPASCTMDTGSFPGVKCGRGVTLTPHPLLVLLSRKRRVIPLLPLWTVRPVQSLSACTRVHFTLLLHLYKEMGTTVAQWLKCCATNRKVAGSISDGVSGFFIDINTSDRTMALGSTQPLTEMNTSSISRG